MVGRKYGVPANAPSLVPGRLALLIAEAGREGGPIGLCGVKKLDFRLPPAGEGGMCERLSIVLSEREGLDFRGFGVDSSWAASS